MSGCSAWPRVVIFDLDGTLVDSAPDIRLALNEAFAPLGAGPFALHVVKGLIGGGAVIAVRRAATHAGVALDEGAERDVLARFYPALSRASSAGRGLYPGALALLTKLQASGRTLALCTNKAHAATRAAIKALGLEPYFAVVQGARDGIALKPDPAPLQGILETLGASASDAVMVGDSSADITAARAAGCRSVAVAHGYSNIPASELGADALAANLPDVLAAIGRLAAATRLY